MEMPELPQAFHLYPITALAFSPVGFSIPLILAGEGSNLKVFSRTGAKVSHCLSVFESQAIHGIQCEVNRAFSDDPGGASDQLRCLVWGGRSAIVLSLGIEQLGSEYRINVSPLTRETILLEWILCGSMAPSVQWTDGFTRPFVQAVLVTAHNKMISLELSRVFESDSGLTTNAVVCSSGPPLALFSAHCIWRGNRDIIVAAGSMFGEVLIWKSVCDFQHSPVKYNPGILLQSLPGHDGSVFGVHMAIAEASRDASLKYVLASCSDDRSVRLWDISKSFATHHQGWIVCQSSHTGFGSLPGDENQAALASADGHLSRIWSVRIVCSNDGEFSVFSFGEDATSQLWYLTKDATLVPSRVGRASIHRLETAKSFSSHSSKNLWSSEIQLQKDGSVFMVTGGADGRTVLQVPVHDSQALRCNFAFSKLQEFFPNGPREYTSSSGIVFDSMRGNWSIHRTIISALSSYPSGTFEGSATLVERPPTDGEYDREILYAERGKFTTNQGFAFEGSRRYVYRYQEASSRITAWFVTLDEEAKVDYLFHQVTFDAKGNQQNASGQIVASGHHLCIRDDYNAEYAFPFDGTRLDTWSLKYLVAGPFKDYIASATYTRIPGPEPGLKDSPQPAVESAGIETESIKAYCWLSINELLATTSTGHVLHGTISLGSGVANSSQINIHWKVIDQKEDLQHYSSLTRLPGLGAIINGNSGQLWIYSSKTNQVEPLTDLSRKLARIITIEMKSHDGTYYGIIATCLGSDTATLITLQSDRTRASYKIISQSQLDLPEGSNITSALYLPAPGLLLLGLRTGSILIFSPPSPTSPPSPLPLLAHLTRIHHRDAVTSLTPLTPLPSSDPSTTHVLTTGREGHITIQALTHTHTHSTDPALSLEKVHSSQPPLGSMIEGSALDARTSEILIWGFRGRDFVAYNLSQHREVFSVECGGAHRSWDFLLAGSVDDYGEGRDGPGGEFGCGNLVWTKAGECRVLVQRGGASRVLKEGGHGREIKALACKALEGGGEWGGKKWLVATGSEDTTVRLSVYESQKGDGEGMRTVGMVSKHITGIQQLRWSEDGRRLFSCGGREEFMVWRVRRVPCVEVGVVFEAKCPPVTELWSHLRIMDFIVEEAEGGFVCSMVYSDSSLRVWSYDLSTATFKLLATGNYSSNCLTQIAAIELDSIRYLLIAATDGHIALWPVPDNLVSFEASRDLHPLLRHQIHQSSIKVLSTLQIDPSIVLVATGGDDNALGLTLLTVSSGAADNSNSRVPQPETLLIPKAHAASVTALQWLKDEDGKDKGEGRLVRLLSASNDQVMKTWEVRFGDLCHGVKDLEVKKGKEYQTEVADVACMEVMRAGEERRVALAGVGLETWRI